MIGRYWEDDETWFGDYVDLVDESLDTGEPVKPCTPVPCGVDDRDVMPDLTGFVVDDER